MRPVDDGGRALLGLLLTIAVLGVSAAIAVAALGGDGSDDDPGSSDAAIDEAVSTVASAPGEAADLVACGADREAIDTAEEVYRVQHDDFATMETLVAERYLVEASTLHEVVLAPDGSSYTLVGRGVCP